MEFRVQGLGFGVWSEGLGLRVEGGGLRLRVEQELSRRAEREGESETTGYRPSYALRAKGALQHPIVGESMAKSRQTRNMQKKLYRSRALLIAYFNENYYTMC